MTTSNSSRPLEGTPNPSGRLRLTLPAREHIAPVDPSDPLTFYYSPLSGALYRERLHLALELLGPGPFGTLLEAGYGSGVLLPTLSKACDHLIALDLHERPDLVQHMLSAERVSASLGRANVCQIGLASESVDAIVCASTLEHLHDDELAQAVAELRRVLRPTGVAVIAVPGSGWLMNVLFRAIGFNEIDDHHHSSRAAIEAELARQFQITRQARMPRMAPRGAALYTVFRCTR
jgi:SAM-dependent methyltransferase